MKKIIGSIIICMILAYSCANENETQSDVTITSELSIEQKLANYNTSIITTAVSVPRGFWGSFWGKLAATVLSDAGGYLVGWVIEKIDGDDDNENPPHKAGVASAGVASAFVGVILWGSTPPVVDDPNAQHDDFNVIYNVPTLYSDEDMGPGHNIILNKLLTTENTIEEIVAEYFDEESDYPAIDAELNQSVEDLMTEFDNSDFDINVLLNNDLMPSFATNILNLFYEGLNNCNSDTQVSELITFYSDSVLESNDFDEDQKAAFVGTFSVARSSLNYWYNNYSE